MKRTLPPRVYKKHGAFYFVDLEYKWHKLSREDEGLPKMYRALAALRETATTSDMMPAVIARWTQSKIDAGDWSSGTQTDMERVGRIVGGRFEEFRPSQVTAPTVFEYLKAYAKQPRTYNLHRTLLKSVMSFAALEGLRDGHNPVDDVPRKKTSGRHRIVTDDEIKAIKESLMMAARGGRSHVLMLDMCLETGQRIGDVLGLRWQDVTDDGILVDQSKSGGKTKRLIEHSDLTLAIVTELAQGRDKIGHLFVTSTGKPYTYSAIRSAWVRALARAGIEDLNIHDLRGRAGADVADSADIYTAQKLLGHQSVTMTEHYVRGKTRQRVAARSKLSNS